MSVNKEERYWEKDFVFVVATMVYFHGSPLRLWVCDAEQNWDNSRIWNIVPYWSSNECQKLHNHFQRLQMFPLISIFFSSLNYHKVVSAVRVNMQNDINISDNKELNK